MRTGSTPSSSTTPATRLAISPLIVARTMRSADRVDPEIFLAGAARCEVSLPTKLWPVRFRSPALVPMRRPDALHRDSPIREMRVPHGVALAFQADSRAFDSPHPLDVSRQISVTGTSPWGRGNTEGSSPSTSDARSSSLLTHAPVATVARCARTTPDSVRLRARALMLADVLGEGPRLVSERGGSTPTTSSTEHSAYIEC